MKKVIEIKDELFPGRITKNIHPKKDIWEKRVINSESSKGGGSKERLPIEKQKNKIKDYKPCDQSLQ